MGFCEKGKSVFGKGVIKKRIEKKKNRQPPNGKIVNGLIMRDGEKKIKLGGRVGMRENRICDISVLMKRGWD